MGVGGGNQLQRPCYSLSNCGLDWRTHNRERYNGMPEVSQVLGHIKGTHRALSLVIFSLSQQQELVIIKVFHFSCPPIFLLFLQVPLCYTGYATDSYISTYSLQYSRECLNNSVSHDKRETVRRTKKSLFYKVLYSTSDLRTEHKQNKLLHRQMTWLGIRDWV